MAGPEYLVFNKAVYKDIDGVAYADGVGIGTTVALSSLHVGTTDGVILPRGTEGQRPIAPEIGLIRYNTSLSQFEGFTDNGWGGIGGGAVSVDRLTYISASNDSNLRFYTGGTLQAVLNPYGNLGVGTSNPEYRLDVRGEAYLESFRASNFTVLNDFTYVADGNSVRMTYQVNPTRYTVKLTAPTSNFDITVEGLYAVYTSNIEIYVNGTKLGYVSPAVGDYTSTYTTVGNSNTLAQISLKSAIPAENNVDIVIYPSYLAGLGSLKPGYVQQNYTLTYWTKYDTTENIYYNLGNVGIGTTYAIEQVHVEGDMWVRHMYASNFTVGNEFTYLPDGDSVRMTYQIAPTRYSEIIYEAAGKSNFDITVQGLYKVRQEDVDFFINGTRIGYLNSNINDYSLLYTGSNDNKQTLVNLTTAFMVPQSNAVSITVYPSYLDDYGQKAPGYTVQNYNLTYWSRYSDTSNIYYNNGNVGIGTTAAKELLHVEGDMFVQNIQASNVDVLANFYLAGDSDIRRRYYQLQPSRLTEKIADLAGKSNFEVVLEGMYKVDGSNTEVNVNGSKLAYITSNVADYSVSSFISTSNTVVTITTADLIAYDNIVDIAVYPQYLDAQLATYPGYMVLNLNSLYWDRNTIVVGGSNQTTMSYSQGNIGIGTTVARARLEVNGGILPSACNLFDLGASNLRWRDLFLSGGTIDMEGVRIGTGVGNTSLEFRLGGATRMTVLSTGNVGVGTTTVGQALQVEGNIALSGGNRFVGTSTNNTLSLRTNNLDRVLVDAGGNVGIGTAVPSNAFEVAGNIIASGTVSSGTGMMFRNKIINGDMRINQRGTSTNLASMTAVGTTFGYVADRWGVLRAGYATGAQMAQGTNLGTSDLPYTAAGIKTFARASRISGNTSTNTIACLYGLETQDSYAFAGKTVTLSFYYRTGANFSASSLLIYVSTGTGTDEGFQRGTGFTGGITNGKTVTPNTSWTYATYTVTLSASLNQVGVGFEYFPTGTAGANDWFDITGVQLELGSVATPFELRPIATELMLCQRYYQNLPTIGVSYYASVNGQIFRYKIPLPVYMRTAPTASTTTSSAVNVFSGYPTIDILENLSIRFNTVANAAGYIDSYCNIFLTSEL